MVERATHRRKSMHLRQLVMIIRNKLMLKKDRFNFFLLALLSLFLLSSTHPFSFLFQVVFLLSIVCGCGKSRYVLLHLQHLYIKWLLWLDLVDITLSYIQLKKACMSYVLRTSDSNKNPRNCPDSMNKIIFNKKYYFFALAMNNHQLCYRLSMLRIWVYDGLTESSRLIKH